jgi:hypothetical protein
MSAVRMIDDVIEAGWYVVESGYDVTAFRAWKERAFACVSGLMGTDHPYTRYFGEFVSEAEQKNVLTGEGILTAVKEQISLDS